MNINNETPAALEAILFACGGPVAFDRLCEILGINSEGLREAASLSARKAAYLRQKLIASGKFSPGFGGKFAREFAVRPVSGDAARVAAAVEADGFIGGYDLGKDYPELAGGILIAVGGAPAGVIRPHTHFHIALTAGKPDFAHHYVFEDDFFVRPGNGKV